MEELVMRLSAAGTLPRPQPRPAVRISRKKGCSGVRYRVREDRGRLAIRNLQRA